MKALVISFLLVGINPITVMILSFQTGRSGQTADQTAPRGAVWSGSTLFAIQAASFGCITLKVKPSCSNFRVLTANFLGVRIFRIFMVNCHILFIFFMYFYSPCISFKSSLVQLKCGFSTVHGIIVIAAVRVLTMYCDHLVCCLLCVVLTISSRSQTVLYPITVR